MLGEHARSWKPSYCDGMGSRWLCHGLRVATLSAPLLLAGCAPAPEPEEPDTIVNVTFLATPALNPDLDGRPSPAVIRVFALANEDAFRTASYFELRDSAEDVLGDALLGERDLLINPGASIDRRITFPNEARALGVVVDFQNIETAVWRSYVNIRAGEVTSLRATLTGDHVRLTLVTEN